MTGFSFLKESGAPTVLLGGCRRKLIDLAGTSAARHNGKIVKESDSIADAAVDDTFCGAHILCIARSVRTYGTCYCDRGISVAVALCDRSSRNIRPQESILKGAAFDMGRALFFLYLDN